MEPSRLRYDILFRLLSSRLVKVFAYLRLSVSWLFPLDASEI